MHACVRRPLNACFVLYIASEKASLFLTDGLAA
jgi:hypothetical protein